MPIFFGLFSPATNALTCAFWIGIRGVYSSTDLNVGVKTNLKSSTKTIQGKAENQCRKWWGRDNDSIHYQLNRASQRDDLVSRL